MTAIRSETELKFLVPSDSYIIIHHLVEICRITPCPQNCVHQPHDGPSQNPKEPEEEEEFKSNIITFTGIFLYCLQKTKLLQTYLAYFNTFLS